MSGLIHMKRLFALLNSYEIEYCVMEYNQKDNVLELLVCPENQELFVQVLTEHNYRKKKAYAGEQTFIYGLIPDIFWESPDGYILHSACQMSCANWSNMIECKIPLDKRIQSSVWLHKIWDETNECWEINDEDYLIYVLSKCVFNQKNVDNDSIQWIQNCKAVLDSQDLYEKLEGVFFRFTSELIRLIREKRFEEIIPEYKRFIKY